MRAGITKIVLAALLVFSPALTWAALTPYSQNFEGLSNVDTDALANDGWLVFGNVFNTDSSYDYGYGAFPAPNDIGAFSGVDVGQGGPTQGAQQLVVYSDYKNLGAHGSGQLVESNVYQEQMIDAGDFGSTLHFEFDAKLGNLELASTASAFIKTVDPDDGYTLTNVVTIDMTTIPTTWDRYSLSFSIDSDLRGQLLQFGFLNTAANFEGSAVFYDNLDFRIERAEQAVPAVGPIGLLLLGSLLFGGAYLRNRGWRLHSDTESQGGPGHS